MRYCDGDRLQGLNDGILYKVIIAENVMKDLSVCAGEGKLKIFRKDPEKTGKVQGCLFRKHRSVAENCMAVFPGTFGF